MKVLSIVNRHDLWLQEKFNWFVTSRSLKSWVVTVICCANLPISLVYVPSPLIGLRTIRSVNW